MSKRVTILGVPIDAVTMEEAVTRLESFGASQTQHHIMTPNPEMLVEATRNNAFYSVLQQTSLNIPDGVGLLFAARVFGERLPARVTGTDLVTRIAASPELQPVFFLGAGEGVAKRAAATLSARFSELKVAGTFAGSPRSEDEEKIVQMIVASGAKTLLVAYGAPTQDLWIERVLQRLECVRIAVGVGGAFDFIAGVRKRAPDWMKRCSIEWAWRLIQEPSRIGRIGRAVIVFPVLALGCRFFRSSSRAENRTL